MGRPTNQGGIPLTYSTLCSVCHHEVDDTKKGSFRVLPRDILQASRVNEPEIVHKYDQSRFTHTLEVGARKFKYHRHDNSMDAPSYASARLLHLRCFDVVHRLGDNTKLDSTRVYHVVNAVEPTFDPLGGTAVKSIDGPFVDSEGNWKKRTTQATSAPSPAMKGLAGLINKFPHQVRCLISDKGCGRMFFILDVADWMAKGKRGTSRQRDRFSAEYFRLTGDKIQINLVQLGGRTYIQSFADVPAQQPTATKAVKGKPKTRKQRKAAEQAAATAAAQSVQSKGNSRDQVVIDLANKKDTFFAVKSDGVGIVDVAFEEATLGPKWTFGHQTAPFDHLVSHVSNADLSELQVVSDCLKVRAVLPWNRRGAEPCFDSPHRQSHYGDFARSSVGCAVEAKGTGAIRLKQLRLNDPIPYFAPAKYLPMNAINDITIDWCINRRAGMTGFHVNKGRDQSFEPKSFKVAHAGPDPEDDSPRRRKSEDLFYTGTFDVATEGVDFTISGTETPDASRRVKVVTFEPAEDNGFLRKTLTFVQFDVGNTFLPQLPHYPEYQIASEEIVEDVRGIWWTELPPFYPVQVGLVRGKQV